MRHVFKGIDTVFWGVKFNDRKPLKTEAFYLSTLTSGDYRETGSFLLQRLQTKSLKHFLRSQHLKDDHSPLLPLIMLSS